MGAWRKERTTNVAVVEGKTGERNEVDERLMAAAPELLAALRNVLPLARKYLKHAPSHPDHDKIDNAYDVIERVEGRQRKLEKKL
jgi:hypothetical protein